MDNASKNASDMIGTLQMQYNRGRQAAITNELVDIITGASRLLFFVSFSLPSSCFPPSFPLFFPLLPCFPLPPFTHVLFPDTLCSFSFPFLVMCPSNAYPFLQVPALSKPRAYVRNKKSVDTTVVVVVIASCMRSSCQRFIDLTRLLA
jgi:hypothetical protein